MTVLHSSEESLAQSRRRSIDSRAAAHNNRDAKRVIADARSLAGGRESAWKPHLTEPFGRAESSGTEPSRRSFVQTHDANGGAFMAIAKSAGETFSCWEGSGAELCARKRTYALTKYTSKMVDFGRHYCSRSTRSRPSENSRSEDRGNRRLCSRLLSPLPVGLSADLILENRPVVGHGHSSIEIFTTDRAACDQLPKETLQTLG